MFEDSVQIGVPDPTKIPDEMVPSFVNFIDTVCKTGEQRAQAQAYLDARDMTLNTYLHGLLSGDGEHVPSNLSDEEEAALLHDLGLD